VVGDDLRGTDSGESRRTGAMGAGDSVDVIEYGERHQKYAQLGNHLVLPHNAVARTTSRSNETA
jgi:hypothetical protein